MVRSEKCFLCGKRANENRIRLYRFPKNPSTRTAWIIFCGLCEAVDNVSNLKICSLHFSPADFTQFGRLKPYTIPSISKPKRPSIPTAATLLNVLTPLPCASTKVDVVVGSDVMISNEISQASLSVNMSKELLPTEPVIEVFIKKEISDEVCDEIPLPLGTNEVENVCDPLEVDCNDENAGVETDIYQTRKCRSSRFAVPRFVQEIDVSDLATPQLARSVLFLVKSTDRLKSKKIKSLQSKNRYLTEQVSSLKKELAERSLSSQE